MYSHVDQESVDNDDLLSYYARMMKDDKNRSTLLILQQGIRLLTMKLDSLQKQCNEADVLKKHLNKINAVITAETSGVCHLSSEHKSDFALTKRCSLK